MLLRGITRRGRAAYNIGIRPRALYVYESARGPRGAAGAIAGCRATRVRIDEDVSTAAQRLWLYPRVVADVDLKRGPCSALSVSLLS